MKPITIALSAISAVFHTAPWYSCVTCHNLIDEHISALKHKSTLMSSVQVLAENATTQTIRSCVGELNCLHIVMEPK